jgi:hypothetical protein
VSTRPAARISTEASVGDCPAIRRRPLADVAAFRELQHVGEPNPPVTAAGETLGGDLTVIEKPSDEWSRQPEQFGGLSGSQRGVRGEHRQPMAVGHLSRRGSKHFSERRWESDLPAVREGQDDRVSP